VQWNAYLRLFKLLSQFTFVGRSGLARSHGDAEDGVGAKVALVVGAVQLDHEVVDGGLCNNENERG
jgi:hypothetical protein